MPREPDARTVVTEGTLHGTVNLRPVLEALTVLETED